MKTKLILSIPLYFSILSLFAQGAPPATPIDGGLSILLAAGGLYGIKKLRDNHRS